MSRTLPTRLRSVVGAVAASGEPKSVVGSVAPSEGKAPKGEGAEAEAADGRHQVRRYDADSKGSAMSDFSRGRYFSTVMPVAAIIYVIVLFLTKFNSTVVIVGALLFALIVVLGSRIRGSATGRQRNRNRGAGG